MKRKCNYGYETVLSALDMKNIYMCLYALIKQQALKY